MLGVSTTERLKLAPDVATIAEAVPGFQSATDVAMFVFGLGDVFLNGYRSDATRQDYAPGHRLGYLTDAEYRPFVVERPGKNGRIKLGPEAKYWAEQHGMSLTEMARYLLLRDEQGLELPTPGEGELELPDVSTALENLPDE